MAVSLPTDYTSIVCIVEVRGTSQIQIWDHKYLKDRDFLQQWFDEPTLAPGEYFSIFDLDSGVQDMLVGTRWSGSNSFLDPSKIDAILAPGPSLLIF